MPYFSIFEWMISILKLRNSALLVFAFVFAFSRSNQCAYRGGMRRMAKELGISVNSATNAMKLLLERNLIIKKQRYANRFWYIVNMDKVQELCGNVAIFDTRMHRKLVPDNIDEKTFLVIRDSYNKICKSLPRITELTQAQKHMMSTLLKTFTVDEIKKGFLLAEESDYLKGSNGAWRADFDWLIRPDNICKVLEKRYTNYRKAKIPGWSDKGGDISDEEMEMIRQALSET